MVHNVYERDSDKSVSFTDFISSSYLNNRVVAGLPIRASLRPLVNQLGFTHATFIAPEKTFETPGDGDGDDDRSDLMLIYHLPLIEMSNTSWDQILECRDDKEAAIKMRRLRYFSKGTMME